MYLPQDSLHWNKLILLNTHFKDNILHSAPLRLYYLYSSSFWTILLKSTWSLIHCVTLRVCPDWFQLWWLLPFGLVIVVLVPLLAIVTLWSHRSCLFPKLVLPTSGCWVGPIGLWDLHSMRICETRLRMGSSGRIQFGRVNAGVFTMCRFRSSAQIGYCWSNLGAL